MCLRAADTSFINQSYFEQIDIKQPNGFLLESSNVNHMRSSMIIFGGKAHTPLAAVAMKSAKEAICLPMMTDRPSPKDSIQVHFQGILNKID